MAENSQCPHCGMDPSIVGELVTALKWALPLADIALEECRQQRLKAGHNDIGRGTERVGLWPDEQKKLADARAVLSKVPDHG